MRLYWTNTNLLKVGLWDWTFWHAFSALTTICKWWSLKPCEKQGNLYYQQENISYGAVDGMLHTPLRALGTFFTWYWSLKRGWTSSVLTDIQVKLAGRGHEFALENVAFKKGIHFIPQKLKNASTPTGWEKFYFDTPQWVRFWLYFAPGTAFALGATGLN